MTHRVETLRGLEREVTVMVRRIKRVLGERARAVHEDLQPSSYMMLSFLADEGPVRASSMVEQLSLDKGAVSRHLQHLEELGLVERTPDPDDGRASLVAASDEGRRRLDDVTEYRRKGLDERLADWSHEELEGFVEALARYNRTLDS